MGVCRVAALLAKTFLLEAIAVPATAKQVEFANKLTG